MARQLFSIILVIVAVQYVMMATIPSYLENLQKVNETSTEATTTTTASYAWRHANESKSVGPHHLQKRYAEDNYDSDTTEYYHPTTTTSGYHHPTTTVYNSYTTEYTTPAPFFGLKQKGKLVIKELDRAIKTVIAYIAGVLLTPFVLASKVLPPPPPPLPVTEYY